MQITAGEIAGIIQGEIEGNPEAIVSKISKIEEGEAQGISFLDNPEYNKYLYTTKASVVIINADFKLEKPVKDSCTLIRVENARLAFADLLAAYHKMQNTRSGISSKAAIDTTAVLGKDCFVGDFTSIGRVTQIGGHTQILSHVSIGDNVRIGTNCTIHSGVIIESNSVIGNNCTLQPNCVIGGDGFGFVPNQKNNYKKVVHIGNAVLEDFVEVGANTTIDKGTIGSTIIRKGVKLDNLIQVAHNVEIGENTVIAAQTGIAGSTIIGKNCMIGGQVGIVGHIKIADGVKIAAQSGIGNSIEKKGEIVQGSPAFGIGDFKRSYVMFRQLPDIKQKLSEIEKQIK